MKPAEAYRLTGAIAAEIDRAIVGRRDAVDHVLVAALAGGHVLLEDLPGLGKTQLARCLATTLGCAFTRVQFTPDLLPSDLTGSSLFDPRTQEFVFHRGPIFTHVLLADEINRTPPKTQAALLEAMQEGQVSIDGVTTPLEPPFIVLATQNPLEFEGTYPLPEAQLDRFAIRLALGYLPRQREADLLRTRLQRRTLEVQLDAVTDPPTLLAMREALEDVHVDEDIVDYVMQLVQATREHSQVLVGASPRAALTLVQLARGRAVVSGRDFVTGDDVKIEAEPALAHRLTLEPETWVRRITGTDIVREVVRTVPVPAIEPERLRASTTAS
jgi:MoxR-like ATPase